MEERESKGFKRFEKVPWKSSRWGQIPAGPVVPAQRAVLPPYAKLRTNGTLQKKLKQRKPARPVVPAHPKQPTNG